MHSKKSRTSQRRHWLHDDHYCNSWSKSYSLLKCIESNLTNPVQHQRGTDIISQDHLCCTIKFIQMLAIGLGHLRCTIKFIEMLAIGLLIHVN